MKICLATITPRKQAAGPAGELQRAYIERATKYMPCTSQTFRTEHDLLAFVSAEKARTQPVLVLADSRGKDLSSEEFSAALGRYRDAGTQTVVFAIGPADGWSAAAREAASLTIAFGRITLPHELAAVVAAEQIYRALTILAGHPYHSGH